jgi:tRNA(fMet)-specific endonuclease VapC
MQRRPGDVPLPAIVAYEVWVGVLCSQDAKRRREQFEKFLSVVSILPFDADAAHRAAEVRLALQGRGEPIGPLDTLIAATVLANSATLVTRNQREFKRVPGLAVVNWYD